jgi:hypothetical protein
MMYNLVPFAVWVLCLGLSGGEESDVGLKTEKRAMMGLLRVPRDLPTDVQILDLKRNNINFTEADDFKGLYRIQELWYDYLI